MTDGRAYDPEREERLMELGLPCGHMNEKAHRLEIESDENDTEEYAPDGGHVFEAGGAFHRYESDPDTDYALFQEYDGLSNI